jgi:hypothetical protein
MAEGVADAFAAQYPVGDDQIGDHRIQISHRIHYCRGEKLAGHIMVECISSSTVVP